MTECVGRIPLSPLAYSPGVCSSSLSLPSKQNKLKKRWRWSRFLTELEILHFPAEPGPGGTAFAYYTVFQDVYLHQVSCSPCMSLLQWYLISLFEALHGLTKPGCLCRCGRAYQHRVLVTRFCGSKRSQEFCEHCPVSAFFFLNGPYTWEGARLSGI